MAADGGQSVGSVTPERRARRRALFFPRHPRLTLLFVGGRTLLFVGGRTHGR